MLQEGTKAPVFSLKSDDGKTVSLDSFSGKKVVVYFYPKDDTPGCTKEACSFRDVYDDILAKGAVVLGISRDNESSHLKFRAKFNLPFYLLSDPDHAVIDAFGAWGEKTFMGKTSMGIIRSTFIIDEKGYILKVFPKVTPEGHAQEVLALL